MEEIIVDVLIPAGFIVSGLCFGLASWLAYVDEGDS